MILSKENVLNVPLDSIGFYSFLPTDNLSFDFEYTAVYEWPQLYNLIISNVFYLIEQDWLDELTLFLLAGNYSNTLNGQFSVLSNHLSYQYIYALRVKTKELKKKMFMQRLNFFLRAVVDKDENSKGSEEILIPYKAPWDFIRVNEFKTIYIVSEKNNVIIEDKGKPTQLYSMGLPTQIDKVDNNTLSVGSFYSNGGFLIVKGSVEFINHLSPIVIFFKVNGKLFFLDCNGRIFDEKERSFVQQLPVINVSRARLIGEDLMVMDYAQPSLVFNFNVFSRIQKILYFKEVFIVNDIIKLKEDYFVIDKQQGKVFHYNAFCELISTKLSFGRGMGQLYDPISLRLSNKSKGMLDVLSWVTSKIVSVNV